MSGKRAREDDALGARRAPGTRKSHPLPPPLCAAGCVRFAWQSIEGRTDACVRSMGARAHELEQQLQQTVAQRMFELHDTEVWLFFSL